MLPEAWAEVQPLLDLLLDAPPGERAGLLARLASDNPARKSELEHLLMECERKLPMLDDTALDRFDDLVNVEPTSELGGLLREGYRIQRELGRGGMARVYLAQDLKHGRDVAVKVIRPELAASLGRDRFLREIGIAARLRHPNIMPLFDSGDADGVLYFVMPYEAGPSLRTTLDAGPRPSVDDALNILRDVAKALAYAHAQGVVHRDVKPDNVMLSGGTAVVTDFGIAKAVSAARGEAGGTAITQGGVGIGTPAYMAPEQAVGDPTTKPSELADALVFLRDAPIAGWTPPLCRTSGSFDSSSTCIPGSRCTAPQMTVHDESGARVMRELGIDCVVPRTREHAGARHRL